MNLKTFESNIRSQFGEDGVIQELFRRIGTGQKYCVEFGAWDGEHFSNTWTLWAEQGWKALLIEGDPKKHQDLVQKTANQPQVTPLCAYVSPEGPHSLDNIFDEQGAPTDIDLLSIDIDGDDYHILQTLTRYRPRLIIIEYNPTIPPHIALVQARGEYFGASARAILELAHQKDYALVHMTDTNMFLLRREELPALGFDEPSLEEMFVPRHLAYVVTAYDGRAFLAGNTPYAHFAEQRTKTQHPVILPPGDAGIQKIMITKPK